MLKLWYYGTVKEPAQWMTKLLVLVTSVLSNIFYVIMLLNLNILNIVKF